MQITRAPIRRMDAPQGRAPVLAAFPPPPALRTMSDAAPPSAHTAPPAVPERRRNAALRELIDEMLASIRTATRNELWTAEERTQYEKEIGEIMARVRAETVRR